MNKVILAGYIGNEPEVRYTQTTNKMLVSFNVATREGKDKTEWHKCMAWEKQAEFISKYFHKGSYIALTGCLQTRNYQDKDGKTTYVTEIVVDNAEFGGSKDKEQTDFTPVTDEDLPF